jgi:hypothetical protein
MFLILLLLLLGRALGSVWYCFTYEVEGGQAIVEIGRNLGNEDEFMNG